MKEHLATVTAADDEQALAIARAERPDLVLPDAGVGGERVWRCRASAQDDSA